MRQWLVDFYRLGISIAVVIHFLYLFAQLLVSSYTISIY